MEKKRGLLPIAESLDTWHILYSAFIALFLLVYLPVVRVTITSLGYVTTTEPSTTLFVNALEAWAVIFTLPSLALSLWYHRNPIVQARRVRMFVRVRSLAPLMFALVIALIVAFIPLRSVPPAYQGAVATVGADLALAFYALIAIIGPGFLIYILNPAARNFFFEYPFGYREKLRILQRFREYEELTRSRFSFLLAEVYRGTMLILAAGFPYLDPVGLADTFTDIQLAMRVGTDAEKEAVTRFFENTSNIPYRIGTLGKSYSDAILLEMNQVRGRLIWSDNLRQRNNIKGVWRNGVIELLSPYRDWILVGLTTLLVVLTLILILLK